MSASHQAPFIAASEPASPERRAFALRDELVDRGLVETGDAEALVHNAAQELSPINGARVVARAWVDPHFRQRLLVNATAAAKELGIEGPEGHQMVAVENTATTHNVIVCTQCSCTAWPLLGLPPDCTRHRHTARASSEKLALCWPRWGSSCPLQQISAFGTPVARRAMSCCRCGLRGQSISRKSNSPVLLLGTR